MMDSPAGRFRLRDLPLAARLVIAVFLVSVGLGYIAALVQLHFQNASAGRLLPDAADAVNIYYGRPQTSQLERLLDADEKLPFGGSGTMKPAFFGRSLGWLRAIRQKAKKDHLSAADAEAKVREEREGERQAVLAWIRSGADQKAYQDNLFPLPAELAGHPITPDYVQESAGGKGPSGVLLRDIFRDRCARCHDEGKEVAHAPLTNYEQIHDYLDVQGAGGGMSLKKLAQSTHVHLLSFAMLYTLTGLAFAFTSYPRWVRLFIAPAALVCQVIDVSCWWLGRTDPLFARAIVVTGGAVGALLFVQILGSLVDLFGRVGRIILILVLAAALAGGYVVQHRVVSPYLAQEARQGGPLP